MTRVTVDKDNLRKFVQSFGHNVTDLKLSAHEFSLNGGVAMLTHFFTQRISATVDEAGEFIIPDISKVVAFLRACDGNTITMWQRPGRPLHLSNGSTEVTISTADSVRSSERLSAITKHVSKSIENDWSSWADEPLNCHGKIEDTGSLLPVSRMVGVVGKDKVFTTNFGNNCITFSAGDKTDAQMNVTVEIGTGVVPDDGVTNTFGAWLPTLLNALPAGPCHLHTGEDSVMVFSHAEKECLLVVFPQGE